MKSWRNSLLKVARRLTCLLLPYPSLVDSRNHKFVYILIHI